MGCKRSADASLIKNPYRVILLNMHSSAWDLAKTSPATAHIPLKERLTYASLYGAIENWREFISEENVNSNALSALLLTADEPENRRLARVRLAQARLFLNRRQLNYGYFFERFDELGIKPDYGQQTIRVQPESHVHATGAAGLGVDRILIHRRGAVLDELEP